MVMDTMQIRLTEGLVDRVDLLVRQGLYANRSDAVRDAVRRLVLERQIGTIPNKGNSVREIRKIRKSLSRNINIDEINRLGK